MKKIIVIAALFLVHGSLFSQILGINRGQVYFFSKTVTPALNQRYEVNNIVVYDFYLEDIYKYKGIQFGIQSSLFDGWVSFNIDHPNGYFGFGSSSTWLFRFGIHATYDVFKKWDKISLEPKIILFYERVIPTYSDYVPNYQSYRATVDERIDPDYVGDVFLQVNKRDQILPAIGFNFKWNVFWRIYLKVDCYYSYGYNPFQYYYLRYSYKGVTQPTAEWVADGTLAKVTAGIGFYIWKNKKSKM